MGGMLGSLIGSFKPDSTPYYVVVSDNGQAQPNSMNSIDGITWTSANTPSNSSYQKIVYTNGTWVALAFDQTSPRAITSTDGVTWTNRSLPSYDAVWRGLAANGSTLVALAGYNPTGSPSYDTNKFAYSTNTGASWTGGTLGLNKQWYGLAYGDYGFLGVSTAGNIVYSANGITWTEGSTGENRAFTQLVFGNGQYFAASDNGEGVVNFRYGYPGSWSSTTLNYTNTTMTELVYDNGIFVLSGISYNGSSARIATSTNGTFWTQTFAPSTGNLRAKSYSVKKGLWIMALRDSTTVYTSPDAATWTARTASANKSWQSSATRG